MARLYINPWIHMTILSVVMTATPVAAQENAPLLWKARALEAGEKLEALGQKLETFRERWKTEEANETKCEAMLEAAFVLHLTNESMVHKVLARGHVFKIILNGGEQGFFDLSYVYDPEGWRITAMSILSLPREWEAVYPVEARKLNAMLLLVKDKGNAAPRCVFAFSQEAPFLAHVLRSGR